MRMQKRNWVHVHRPGRIGPPGASQPESDNDSGGDSGDEDSDFALRLGVYADQDERLSSLKPISLQILIVRVMGF